ncbi:MAG TPA: hypothetical protein VER96_31075 [Polyangiaceae bacterium]|nr:hypothetical protein [Polyangiaceae bacterium]
MKSNIAIAAVAAVAAGSVGAGALNQVPVMRGSDALAGLTLQVLSNCTALHSLGDPITYWGMGGVQAEEAMRSLAPTQTIAPMTYRMTPNICGGQSSGAEAMVIALDAVTLVGNPATVGPEGIDYPGNAGDPANQWRRVLRIIYTGMDTSAGVNVAKRDCNSAIRQNIVNNWDNVFHGTATACTDSHPSVPGAGASGYDQSNSIIEPGIRHARGAATQPTLTLVSAMTRSTSRSSPPRFATMA